MGVGRLGKALDVQHGEGGVGDGLAEHGLGVGPEGGLQLLVGAVRLHKGEVNAHLLHGHGKQVIGAAIDGGGGHHMVAAVGDVEHGIEVGRLAGGGEHGGGAALHVADLGRHHVVGGVLEPGIEIAAGLQVEQLAHVLAGGILECGGLDNGDLAGLAVARRIAALYALGIDSVIAHVASFFLI